MSATRERQDAMREQFEKWAINRELDLAPNPFKPQRDSDCVYADIVTEDHWRCWQAATADMDELLGVLRDDRDVLINCAQIINVVKIEWGEAWSEWDQSVLDGITKSLTTIYELLARYGRS